MNTAIETKPVLPSLVSGGPIRPIIPQDFEQAWRIGNAIAKAGMQPPGLETPEKITIAILAGMEIGLPPMQAIQSIAIINNRPTIYGDGALALVRASGLLEEMNERTEGQGDAMVAICTVKRRGEPQATVRQFSVVDAKKAGLWTRKGPWEHYPGRMLTMRARAFALRDAFADVLRGLGVAEEQADVVQKPVPPRPPAPVSHEDDPADLDAFAAATTFNPSAEAVSPSSAAAEGGGGEGLQHASATTAQESPDAITAPRAAAGEGSGEPTEPPRPSSLPLGAERRAMIESAMHLATRSGFDAGARLVMLDELITEANDNSGLPPEFIREVVDMAAKVVRKELPAKAATKYLEALP